jgi:hypothetical protein
MGKDRGSDQRFPFILLWCLGTRKVLEKQASVNGTYGVRTLLNLLFILSISNSYWIEYIFNGEHLQTEKIKNLLLSWNIFPYCKSLSMLTSVPTQKKNKNKKNKLSLINRKTRKTTPNNGHSRPWGGQMKALMLKAFLM